MYHLMVINLDSSLLIHKTRDTLLIKIEERVHTLIAAASRAYLCHLNVTHHRLKCPTRSAVAVSCILLIHFIDLVCLRWIFLFAVLCYF